jgi:hypothetical protein
VRVIGLPEPFDRREPFPERLRVSDVAEIVELLPIEVVRGVTIKGRLIDAQDRPIIGARIFVGDASTITDRNGDFMISGALPGPELTYHDNLTPRDKTSINTTIVRQNPLLLRAPIKTSSEAAEN